MSTQPYSQREVGVVPPIAQPMRLRIARDYTGLNQEQFARRMGVSRSLVTNVESGRTKAKPVYISAWALASGVSRHWLETGESPHPGDPDGGVSYTARDSNPEPAD